MANYQRTYKAMGSQFSIRLDIWPKEDKIHSNAFSSTDAERLLAQVEAKTEQLEQCLSRFREDSELVRLMNSQGEWMSVSDEMIQALTLAEHAMMLTKYAFDPRVLPALERIGYSGAQRTSNVDNTNSALSATTQSKLFRRNDRGEIQLISPIDLGGIGKGYTADCLADLIETAVSPFELAGYIVDAGGDIVVAGCQDTGETWGIGIENPLHPSTLAAVASPINNYGQRTALCTSSLWRNAWHYQGEEVHHLIDPVTDKPAATSLYSVTAAADTAAMAETITKYVLLRGFEDAPIWQQHSPRCLSINRSGEIEMTAAMEPYITWLQST